MTLLCTSIFGQSHDAVRGEIQSALAAGAQAIELRLDLMDGISDEDVRRLSESVPAGVSVVLTIRSSAEGGQYDGDDDQLVSRLIELGPLADYIDVELRLWRRSANLRQKVRLALQRAGHVSQAGGVETIEAAARRKLILSRHDTTGRPANLHAEFLEMLSEPLCHAPKLAWRARTVRDNFEALDLLRESPRPATVICMGEDGLASRALAPKFGAALVFTAARAGMETASGQPTAATLKDDFRWDAIDAATRVFGVIGHPVGHSISPAVHNAAFAALHVNAVYLPFHVLPGYESFKAFMVEVLARPWLDFAGFSVTIPHKENAIRFLRESGGELQPVATRIGAVNTLQIAAGGGLRGCNTDYEGVIQAVQSHWKPGGAGFKGCSALVLGAGGAARAVVAALVDQGLQVTVANRSANRATALAEEFSCQSIDWAERGNRGADLLVNCTSLGQSPNDAESPMPAAGLRGFARIFDAVYLPRRTRLLNEASASGCQAIEGLEMFLAQAGGQFRIWTGLEPPLSAMRKVAEKRLGGGTAHPAV